MFNTIKTSRDNKERVIQLTRKLGLGAENTIARVALSYSLSLNRRMELSEIKDSQGKEYSYKVLFGENDLVYLSMISVHYNLHLSNRDLAKYIKMHIDDGLEILDKEYLKNPSIAGTDFLIYRIEKGLKSMS